MQKNKPCQFSSVQLRRSIRALTGLSRSSRYGPVSAGVARRLRQLGAEIHYVDSGTTGRRPLAPMLWRFTVVDDPQVRPRHISRERILTNIFHLRDRYVFANNKYIKLLLKNTASNTLISIRKLV